MLVLPIIRRTVKLPSSLSTLGLDLLLCLTTQCVDYTVRWDSCLLTYVPSALCFFLPEPAFSLPTALPLSGPAIKLPIESISFFSVLELSHGFIVLSSLRNFLLCKLFNSAFKFLICLGHSHCIYIALFSFS